MSAWKIILPAFSLDDPRIHFPNVFFRLPIPEVGSDAFDQAKHQLSTYMDLPPGSLPVDRAPTDEELHAAMVLGRLGPSMRGDAGAEGADLFCGHCGLMVGTGWGENSVSGFSTQCPQCNWVVDFTVGPLSSTLGALLQTSPELEVLQGLSDALDQAKDAQNPFRALKTEFAPGKNIAHYIEDVPDTTAGLLGLLALLAVGLSSLIARVRSGSDLSSTSPFDLVSEVESEVG